MLIKFDHNVCMVRVAIVIAAASPPTFQVRDCVHQVRRVGTSRALQAEGPSRALVTLSTLSTLSTPSMLSTLSTPSTLFTSALRAPSRPLRHAPLDASLHAPLDASVVGMLVVVVVIVEYRELRLDRLEQRRNGTHPRQLDAARDAKKVHDQILDGLLAPQGCDGDEPARCLPLVEALPNPASVGHPKERSAHKDAVLAQQVLHVHVMNGRVPRGSRRGSGLSLESTNVGKPDRARMPSTSNTYY